MGARDNAAMVERLQWTLLVGVTGALAALAAARLSEWAWRRLRRAEPPEEVPLFSLLAGRLGQGAARRLLG